MALTQKRAGARADLAKRSFAFTAIPLIASITLLVYGPLTDALGPENVPCESASRFCAAFARHTNHVAAPGLEVNMIFRFVQVTLCPGPLTIRLIRFRHNLAFARFLNDTTFSSLQHALPAESQIHKPAKRSKSVSAVLSTFMQANPAELEPHRASSGQSSNHFDELVSTRSGDGGSHGTRILEAMRIRQSPYYASFLFGFFLVLPMAIVCICFLVLSPWYLHGCKGCLITMAELFVVTFFGLAVVGTGFVSGWLIRKERDPLLLINEIWVTFLVAGGIGFPFVFMYFIDRYIGFIDGRGIFSWQWMMSIAIFAFCFCLGPLRAFCSRRACCFYGANVNSPPPPGRNLPRVHVHQDQRAGNVLQPQEHFGRPQRPQAL